MKLSIISALLIGAVSSVIADLEYFEYPKSGSVYKSGDSVTFVVEDVTDDSDDTIRASLFTADGVYVEEMGEWRADEYFRTPEEEQAFDDGDFIFRWSIDVGDGDYYAEVYEIEGPYGENDHDDDVHRSQIFRVGEGAKKADEKTIATESRKKRSIYSA
ncbi:hypothetical protein EDC94DRAFT_625261 [Helicostylum pulchrum]|uniref:Uncharacterized protein n=1 Tax=Helicostylum pulchrum TaxID=562976 RepID=A0ABP9YBM3_9FUNG|nr:hypothetical protein EDC94DRAFT_625261 [Helicostylum pulchrum]